MLPLKFHETVECVDVPDLDAWVSRVAIARGNQVFIVAAGGQSGYSVGVLTIMFLLV